MLNRGPLRVAVLCSHRAPGLVHLLTSAAGRGRAWDVVCCLTSEAAFDDEVRVAIENVPIVRHPLRRFIEVHAPQAKLGDRRVREEYDRRTVQLLASYRPDVVVLAGYLLLLTRPMLDAYQGCIINVHHSDLLLRDASGAPRYPGLRAVRDAILGGERETRSTAHLVTERLDDGPPLVRSQAYPIPPVVEWARVNGERDLLRSAIWAHQEWMLREGFGPLIAQALEMLSASGQEKPSVSLGRAS